MCDAGTDDGVRNLPSGSGTEPVNVLSRYRCQDGLAYYESTRDTATHFWTHYL